MRFFRFWSRRYNSISIGRQSGLTIIEILIAATIFMIGFSALIFLISRAFVNFSYKDNFNAHHLAREYMECSLGQGDYKSDEIHEIRSGVDYKIVRYIQRESNLVKIRIDVFRENTGKLITSIYNEKYIY